MPRVLQIEDNNLSAFLIERLLAGVAGFSVVSAPTLKEGLDRLKAETFDVVLLDLTLPDGDPANTAAEISTSLAPVPVVVLTGLDDSSEAVQTAKAAAAGYLSKGCLDEREIADEIFRAIERHRSPRRG